MSIETHEIEWLVEEPTITVPSISKEQIQTIKHVLVVDDNDDLLQIIEFSFAMAGYACEAGHSQDEMQAALARSSPDVIVMDLMLPGMNGYQVIEQLRNDPHTRSIPIVVITARAEPMYRRISADLGVAHHLIKPFHPADLVAQVQTILG
jgi:CheY-like chemotaxis protein